MLQSKAGIENKEYKAQRSILADVDAGKISKEDFFAKAEELLKERIAALTPAPAKAPAPVAAAAAAPAPARAAVPIRPVVPAPAAVAPPAEHNAHQPPLEVTKPPRSGAVQSRSEARFWGESSVSEGSDDVINFGICPICEEVLKLAYPDALDVNGQLIHATCAAKAETQPQPNLN
jgi:hypothetical protein